MPYIELIDRVMEREVGARGPELVREQAISMGITDPTDINIDTIPALAKGLSEAIVSEFDRKKAKKVYWELLKLLDIEKIVDGTEDPLMKAAQLADMGDAASYAGEWDKAIEFYKQISATGAPGAGPLAEIKEGEHHSRRNEQAEAREHYIKASNIAKSDGNFIMEAMALRGIGYTSWRMGEFKEALEMYDKAIGVARQVEDPGMEGKLNIDMALVHQSKGLSNEAINKLEIAIGLLKEADNMDELARAYNNMGEAYKELKKYTKAIESYKHCEEIANKVQNEIMKAFSHINSAECFARECLIDEAKKELELGRPYVESMDDDYLLSAVYMINGLIALHEQDWGCMEENFEKDIGLLKKIGYNYELATNSIEYARALKKEGNTRKAKKKLKEARKILASLSSTALLEEVDKELREL